MRSIFERGIFLANRYAGWLLPWPWRMALKQWIYPMDGPQPKMLVVDIVGGCNLRCPSCPVGNMDAAPAGLMDKELFVRIIKKAWETYHIRNVALYNWTEPFLHPDLAGFISIAKAQGMICVLSSNLNVMRDIERVLQAGPDLLRISLSGFTQDVYGKTHARGNIEKVKDNMRALSAAIRHTGAATSVCVYYHKYRHNLHEVAPMREFAQSLGFDWMESWAYFQPLEKVLAFCDGSLKEKEQAFVDNVLALPLADALHAAKNLKGYDRCSLLEDQIVLDYKGNANLCCTVYESAPNHLGAFLDMGEQDMKRAKEAHPTCASCARKGAHKYFRFHTIPELAAQYDTLARSVTEKSV